MYPALEAAKAKWDRGVKDLEALQGDTGRFADGKPYRIVVEFEPDTGWHVAYIRAIEQPPPDLSVLVGSIAYQCLSALNLIAWELAARKVGRKKVLDIARDISFPIAKTAKDFQSLRLISQRHVSKQAIAALCRVQPYNTAEGPNVAAEHPLFLIKELADADKHRVLAAILGRINPDGIEFEWDRAVARNPTVERFVGTSARQRTVREGAPLARIRFAVGNAKAKVRVDRQPSAFVAFLSDTWRIDVHHVGVCLRATQSTIRRLAPLFPGQPNPWV